MTPASRRAPALTANPGCYADLLTGTSSSALLRLGLRLGNDVKRVQETIGIER